jgi:hypothetical protein
LSFRIQRQPGERKNNFIIFGVLRRGIGGAKRLAGARRWSALPGAGSLQVGQDGLCGFYVFGDLKVEHAG